MTTTNEVIVERGLLTELEGRFYTAILVGDLEIGEITKYGVVSSLYYDEGCQHYILSTDLNPQGVRFGLGAEMIVDITDSPRKLEFSGYGG